MVGEAISVDIAVAPHFGNDKQRGAAAKFRRSLDRLPKFPHQAVGPLDGLEIERVGAVVRDVNVPEIHEHQGRREARHHFLGHEKRQLVAARRNARVVEVIEQSLLQARLQLPVQLVLGLVDSPAIALIAFVEGGEHLFIERFAVFHPRPFLRAHRLVNRLEQELLGKNHVCGEGRAEAAVAARTDQAEALVGGGHPGFFGGKFSFLAQALKKRRRGGRLAAERVHVLPSAGDQRGTRIEMSGDPLIERRGIKEALWDQVLG